ncbi:uncharacterized protein LOC131941349 isoform X2 [Physella acuta]|nr:uncharacterized protein LOC131941349 isoform X2 [Physella acuta]XP_059156564.1 uncharacterized protein LOC131941349 isoform X2 [Physella acuta]
MCDSQRFEVIEEMDFLLEDDIASFVDISTSKVLPPEDQLNPCGTLLKGIIVSESEQLMEVHGDQVIDSLPYEYDAWQKDGLMTPFLKTDSIKNKLHSAILSRCKAEGKKLTLDQRRANKVEEKLRPDEEEKKQARKERNKLSAKKSRDIKKAFYDDIKKAHKRLLDENKRMKETNKWLKRQSSKLEKIVMDHDLVCKVAEDDLYKPKYQPDFSNDCFKTKYSVQEGYDSMRDDNCLTQGSDDELHEVVNQSFALFTDIYGKKVVYADFELSQTDTALDCDLETNLTLRDISEMDPLVDQNHSVLSEDAGIPREISTSLCADYIDYLDNPVPLEPAMDNPVPLEPAVCPHDISINLDGPDLSNKHTSKQILPALPHTEHTAQIFSLSQTDAASSFNLKWDPVILVRPRTLSSFGSKSLSTTSSNDEVQSFPPTSFEAEVKLHSQSRYDTLTKPPPETSLGGAVDDPVIVFRRRAPIKSDAVVDPVIVFRPHTPIKSATDISAWSVGDRESSEDIEELTSIFRSLDYGPPPEKKSKF